MKCHLTIDDGPSEYFIHIANWLRRSNIKATFFCIGSKIQARQKEVVDVMQMGHFVVNHSFSHPNFADIGFLLAQQEIIKTQLLLEDLYIRAGVESLKMFRFPFGVRTKKVADFLMLNEFVNPWSSGPDIGWTLDTRDFNRKNLIRLFVNQAKALWNVCRGKEYLVEIGSHRGRSTSILLFAGERVTAIDPFYSDEDHRCFLENMSAHPNFENLRVIRSIEEDAVKEWSEPIDLMHLDHDGVFRGEYFHIKGLLSRWKSHSRSFVIHHYEKSGTSLACLNSGLSLREVGTYMAFGVCISFL